MMGIGGHQSKNIGMRDAKFVCILVITREDIATIRSKTDHAVQDKLTAVGSAIKGNVIFLQYLRLRRKGHLVGLTVEHGQHTGAGWDEGKLLPARKSIQQYLDKLIGRDNVIQADQPL